MPASAVSTAVTLQTNLNTALATISPATVFTVTVVGSADGTVSTYTITFSKAGHVLPLQTTTVSGASTALPVITTVVDGSIPLTQAGNQDFLVLELELLS